MFCLFVVVVVQGIRFGPTEPKGDNHRIEFNRVTIRNNINHQTHIRIHGHNAAMILMNAVLKFSSNVNVFHAPLLLTGYSALKYKSIINEETHKMVITSRKARKILSYSVVSQLPSEQNISDVGLGNQLYALIQSIQYPGSKTMSRDTTYDAVLLLDDYSSLWSEYNVMRFESSRLILEYRSNISISQITRESTAPIVYAGHVYLKCDPVFEDDMCLVVHGPGPLVINSLQYPLYRVIVNLDSTYNYLPMDLYFSFRDQSQNQTLIIEALDSKPLYLNSLFHYRIHDDNTIILGVDLIHHFPRLEYSPETKAFTIWYFTAALSDPSNIETVCVLFTFINLAILFCLYKWTSLYNYHILRFMIYFERYARSHIYFSYKQIGYELVILFLSTIILLCSFLVSSQAGTDSVFQYNGTDGQKRTILFAVFLLYYWILMLIVVIIDCESIKAFWNYYIKREKTLENIQNIQKLKNAPVPIKIEKNNLLLKRKTLNQQSTEAIVTHKKKEEEEERHAKLFTNLEDEKDYELLYQEIVSNYHDPLIKQSTGLAMMRNTTFLSLSLLAILLSYNFYIDANGFFLLLVLLVGGTLIYYKVKYITKGLFFILAFIDRTKQSATLLIIFLVAELLVLILFIIFAYNIVFVAYFDTLNSTYSSMAIATFAVAIIGIMITFSVYMVVNAYDEYAEYYFDRATEIVNEKPWWTKNEKKKVL